MVGNSLRIKLSPPDCMRPGSAPAQKREDWGEFSWLESVSNDGWRLFWQLSENRLHYARITTTGILQWVSTFTVSLPSTIAEMPRRPWDAIKIASHPVFLAVSIMAS